MGVIHYPLLWLQGQPCERVFEFHAKIEKYDEQNGMKRNIQVRRTYNGQSPSVGLRVPELNIPKAEASFS
jgi:hypothetical protein